MSSASCNIFTFSASTSPITLIPNPGPGNGCLLITNSGSPNSPPTRLTSSLNSSFNGSSNSNAKSSGSPPTLWCDLIVCEGPLTD